MSEISLADRVIIVTGASSGLGLAATANLVSRGATVVMAVRNTDKGERQRRGLQEPDRAVVLTLDLAQPPSVKAFSRAVIERFDRLDGLLNNAGIMAPPPTLTPEGIELQWATNHLGHFALTGLLLGLLTATPDSRVVAVSSLAAVNGDLDGYEPTNLDRYRRFQAYANSKLANLLFALELDRRLTRTSTPASTRALAAHPGVTHTNLVSNIRVPGVQQGLKLLSRLTTQSAAQGAEPLVRAIADPAAVGGQYWGPSGRKQYRGGPTPVPVPESADDPEAAARLWRQSIDLSGVSYLVDGN